MFDLTHPSPSVGAFRAQPLTASEIDAHTDCDRIWATIEEMRTFARGEIGAADYSRDSWSDGYAEGRCATADEAIRHERDRLVAVLSEKLGIPAQQGAEICDVLAAHLKARAAR